MVLPAGGHGFYINIAAFFGGNCGHEPFTGEGFSLKLIRRCGIRISKLGDQPAGHTLTAADPLKPSLQAKGESSISKAAASIRPQHPPDNGRTAYPVGRAAGQIFAACLAAGCKKSLRKRTAPPQPLWTAHRLPQALGFPGASISGNRASSASLAASSSLLYSA